MSILYCIIFSWYRWRVSVCGALTNNSTDTTFSKVASYIIWKRFPTYWYHVLTLANIKSLHIYITLHYNTSLHIYIFKYSYFMIYHIFMNEWYLGFIYISIEVPYRAPMWGFYGFVIGIIYNKSTKTLHYHSFITYRLIYTYISSFKFLDWWSQSNQVLL